MRRTGYVLLLFTALLLPQTMAPPAWAAAGNCLSCHGEKTIISTGARLFIDPQKYALTTHARIGCVSCHDKVSPRHPEDGVRPSRAKCRECHASVFAEYQGSSHAKNADCSDCHNVHAVKPLFTVSGRDINIQCAKCHDNSAVVKSHAKWLPQAALHIDALPCITCHTGSKDYVITLYMAKTDRRQTPPTVTLASYEDLRPFLPAGKSASTLIDLNADRFISLEELTRFNRDNRYRDLSLLGTMMPNTVTHTYQILDNRWDCTFCHASGPKAQQASYLAFPEADGTYARMEAEKGAVMDILYGTPDFYMTGFTRNNILSLIGGLIAASGLMVPILHGTLRLLTRKRRKGNRS